MTLDLQKSTVYFRNSFVPFKQATLSIASAPVLYGLSVYTVIPVFQGEKKQSLALFRLQDHFKRLQNSCQIMAFDDFLTAWDYEKFAKTMGALIQKNAIDSDSLLRVSVFVDDNLKGTRMHGLPHSLSAFVYPMTQILPTTGAKLMVSSWRRTPDNSAPSRAKINGSYVNPSLMKHEAVLNGFDDAVALDEQGHVTESTVANIFIVRGGQLISPGDSSDLLEGITRDSIFKFAEHLHIPYARRAIDRSELYLADEIFLSGSSMNISPVISIDHRTIGNGKVGAITAKLQTIYQECAHQQSELFADWLTPVATI